MEGWMEADGWKDGWKLEGWMQTVDCRLQMDGLYGSRQVLALPSPCSSSQGSRGWKDGCRLCSYIGRMGADCAARQQAWCMGSRGAALALALQPHSTSS